MIVCGLGIGPLPIHVMAPEVENGTLWWLPPYDNPPAVDIFLVANPTKRLIRAETEFINAQFSNRGYSPYFRYNLSLICPRLYRKFGTYLRFKN